MNLRDITKRTAAAFLDWRAVTLAPLETPVFRILWVSAFVFNFGAVIQSVGAAWMMTTLAASELMVSLVQAATLAPFLLLSLPAGALADSADRRVILMVAQFGGCLVAGVLAVLAWFNAVSPWILLAATAMIGAVTAIQQPAWHASVGDIVTRERLPAAVGLNSLAFNLARSTGPALGGLIVAISGPFVAFAFNAVASLGTGIVMATQKLPSPPRTAPPEPLHAAIATGLRYVAMAPALKATLLRSTLLGLGGGAIWSLPPLIVHHRLEAGPVAYGLLLAGFGTGSVVGALLSMRLQIRLGAPRQVQMALAALAVATGGIALSESVLLSVLFMTVGGFGWNAAMTTLTSAIQLASPRWVVGRAVALSRLCTFGGLALGSVLCGVTGEFSNVMIACGLSALILLAGLLLPGIHLLPDRTSPDLTPVGRTPRPPAATLSPNSGPITFLIEYRCAPADIPELQAALLPLRPLRLRNGARNWSMSQDIDDPALWIERFDVATWNDYVRGITRGTVADEPTMERARTFRVAGPVRRLLKRPSGALPVVEENPPDGSDAS